MKKIFEKLLNKYNENENVFQEFCDSVTSKDLEGLTLSEIIELYGAMSNAIDGDIVRSENIEDDVDYIYGKKILGNLFNEGATTDKRIEEFYKQLDSEEEFLQELYTESLSGEYGENHEVSGRITELKHCRELLNEIIHPKKHMPDTEPCPF